jgi:hypothetical protein
MESSPGTPHAPLALLTKESIAVAVRDLGPAFADYATKIIEQDVDGPCLMLLLDSEPDDFKQFLVDDLGASTVPHRLRLNALFKSMHPRVPAPVLLPKPFHDDAHEMHERALWLKACLILEACTKGIRPFVGKVMQRLHERVIANVKQDIVRDLGACDDEDWDCSSCCDAEDARFTENAPVVLTICGMDSNGIADCGAAHHLKPHALTPCRLRSIPAGFFSDSDKLSPALPLLICPNPADICNPDSSTFFLLRCLQLTLIEPHLTPFLVTHCDPSEPNLEFTHAVLCSSCPGHTAPQVRSFLLQQPPPCIRAIARGDIPIFSFGFWSLQSRGTKFIEKKHGLKTGHILRFGPGKESSLPPGISTGCRYLVSNKTDFSFTICGPILSPVLPLTQESYPLDHLPFVAIRRSPIAR